MIDEKEKPTTENYVRVHLDEKGKIKGMETNCDYYELGLHFYEKEDWESALYCFNEVIESESNNYEAYIKRGNCYLYLREFENTYYDFDMARKLNHDVEINNCACYAKFSDSLEYKKLFFIMASNDAVLEKKYDNAIGYINQAFDVYYADEDEIEEKHKKSYLTGIENTKELDGKNQQLEEKKQQLEEKNKELNNLVAMFAHNFLGTLQCIRSNAEHENNPSIHLKTVKMMGGALTAFSILSADDDKLVEQLKQDNAGETSLQQSLANNLALAISQLLGKTNKDKIVNLYLRHLHKTQQIESNTTSEELRTNRDYRKKWQALQHQWEDEFNALFSEKAELPELQQWITDNFFPIEIIGLDSCNISFKEYGITDSIFLIVFMEIFVNAFKYMDVIKNKPLVLKLCEEDQCYKLVCENSSSQETGRGTHKGMDFLKTIAKKLKGHFITESTKSSFKATFAIPSELLK